MKVRILVNPNAGKQVVMRELHSIYRAFSGGEDKNEVVMELTVNSAHAAEALIPSLLCSPKETVLSAPQNQKMQIEFEAANNCRCHALQTHTHRILQLSGQ